jgi:hypothetical protein
MKLIQYLEQRVEVTTTQGETIQGLVTDYMDPEDNNPPKESIIIENANGDLIEIFADEIRQVAV